MKLAISPKNKGSIEAALKAVNGRAHEHAFTEFREIREAAERADTELERLGLPMSRRKGAVVRMVSGWPVASSYRNARAGTVIEIQRSGSRWYLTSIQARTLYVKDGGQTTTCLTREQDDYLSARFLGRYSVIGGRRDFSRVIEAVSQMLTAIDESGPLCGGDVRSAADALRAAVQSL